jgi:hypothetical protein
MLKSTSEELEKNLSHNEFKPTDVVGCLDANAGLGQNS